MARLGRISRIFLFFRIIRRIREIRVRGCIHLMLLASLYPSWRYVMSLKKHKHNFNCPVGVTDVTEDACLLFVQEFPNTKVTKYTKVFLRDLCVLRV
jgi:hypothetical protein